MRYLGIDLGSKTVGLAISDTTLTIASSLKTIFFKDEDYLSTIDEIKNIIKEYDIQKIILGLPKNMNNTLVVVIRYFGGIKLGTSGLIVAYKAAAAEAIAAADIVERTVDEEITVSFEYPFMNDIMRIVKEDEPAILEQSYDMDCLMRLRIRKSMMGKLRARLEKVETARIIE